MASPSADVISASVGVGSFASLARGLLRRRHARRRSVCRPELWEQEESSSFTVDEDVARRLRAVYGSFSCARNGAWRDAEVEGGLLAAVGRVCPTSMLVEV